MESTLPAPVAIPNQSVRAAHVRRTLNRAQTIDRIGGHLITAAGTVVLLSVGMILVFLALEALPLISQPAKHPHGSVNAMFVPQLYAGYTTPQYIWQTEASEGGQEKFGVPLLIWGTLKGAIWAMFFSVPLALLSALFVSEFADPRLRTWIKSGIEVLAGIPTVVVGFFAFVTLSTVVNGYYLNNQSYFESGLWILFLLQLGIFAAVGSYLGGRAVIAERPVWQRAAGVLGGLLAALGVAMLAGWLLEKVLGTALQPFFGVRQFTQLNGIMAGFCLGFAIVPLIFSVAEDAMRAVPNSYREASLALGGSRWETAIRVVAPGATAGIYAAVMLGLARAVGETMIVLMASGNTPILDFSPFTGMRTMSAAIAIEASEKAQYSTGYHVLFFVGALLFVMTFILNAATAHIISRLKHRYQVG